MQERLFTECVDIVGTACKPFEGEKTYVSTGAVDCDHISLLETETIDYAGRPSRANLVVEAGDVIFAKMQATQKTLLIDEELAQNIYSTGFCAVRAKRNILTNRCLYHLLTSDMFLSQKDKNCSGATQKAITNAGLSKIRIQTPDIGEQDRISVILDGLSDVIVKRKQELSLLDDLIKARFVEFFGDPRSNPFGYDKKPLGNTCKVITGNTPSRKVPEYYGDYIEWIKTDNIVSELLHPTKASECLSEQGVLEGRIVDENAILMACIAGSVASIGRVCVTDRRVAFNQQINAVVSEQYNILFLYILLKISKDYLVEDINMALKGILSKSKLEEKEFYVPPMELQNEFAEFVKQVDKSKIEVQSALQETQLLLGSLMQDYFG